MDEKLIKQYDQKIDALATELARVSSERERLQRENVCLRVEVQRMVVDRTYVVG